MSRYEIFIFIFLFLQSNLYNLFQMELGFSFDMIITMIGTIFEYFHFPLFHLQTFMIISCMLLIQVKAAKG